MAAIDQCKNCEESFDASFHYCPNCGQETANNLTVGILFSNTIKDYFSFDARFFKSFIPLMTRPGMLARRFVDGKRLTYLHPAQFYLLISVIFFFIFSFTVRKADNEVSKALEKGFGKELTLDSLSVTIDSANMEAITNEINDTQTLTGMSDQKIIVFNTLATEKKSIPITDLSFQGSLLDSLIANGAPEAEKLKAMGMNDDAGVFMTKIFSQLLKLYEQRGKGVLQTLYDTIPIAMFFLLPLFALLLKTLYWNKGTFAHHVVFSFYFFTFIFTTFCLLILAHTVFDVPLWINVLVFLSFILYLAQALHHFYESPWKRAFLKASFISFMYMLIVLPFAMVGVIFVSFMVY